ncbi:hypothetical protein NHH03_01325 [Stieleria sp. TO1_6]|uniref:hypothetical protein n=1 Tax=Stieleria tagensis TaxID=2956795 RepID=UPI00209B3828|nr:hypothetical protein [Stieleria tagensis]MCO8120359.1 hypothetical protein [Stieleria tagensis]
MGDAMKVIRTLNQLKALLPGDTPRRADGEYGFKSVDELIAHNEPELALGALVYIAEAHVDNGTMLEPRFWMTAKQFADQLLASSRTTTFADSLADTIQTIDAHCAPEKRWHLRNQ